MRNRISFGLSNLRKKLEKKISTPKKVLAIIAFYFAAFLCFSLGKLCCYEFFTDVSLYRSNPNMEVVYTVDDLEQYKGKLTECRYVFNDKFGFFSLRISIEGERTLKGDSICFTSPGSISTSLSVSETRRIKRACPRE